MDFEVIDLPDVDSIGVGETAPDFVRPLVNAEYWEDVALSTLINEAAVLLVAYPMDGTGMAKSTWIRIRDRGWGNDDLKVVGLSISTPYAHKSLIDRHMVPYELFSDPNNGVAEEYGIVLEYHGMNGVSGHRPAFFLITRDQVIDYAWIASQWPPSPPYDDIEDAITSIT